ncbi:MAG: peptide deformylase [Nitrospirae bacterium]|nr:peptide deformylase [Nitrospirota bacterium]MBI3350961.1 peptide deformylase [Nitrospirota bacterium]
MSAIQIVKFPDPILREKTRQVDNADGALQKLIDDMVETLYLVPGLGVAAPQVGKSLRLFVYDMTLREGETQKLTALVNPEIIESEGEIIEEEGCLSIPDYWEKVKRAARVMVKGVDRYGKEVRFEAEGLHARLIQHEMDHLNGVLMLDHLSSLKRNILLRKLKKSRKLINED